MVKFINRLTGTAMWVAEERVAEYEAAGHRRAISKTVTAPVVLPKAEQKPEQKQKQEPKKILPKKKK